MSFSDKIFFGILFVNAIVLVSYYLLNKIFIFHYRLEFGRLLYANEDFIESVSLEDIFIMTANFSRVYISYLIEVVLFGKSTTVFFKLGDESDPYIYPNLSFKNMRYILTHFKKWIVLNLIFHLSCVISFIVLILSIEGYIK